MNDCECVCCGEFVPEGMQVCPHCQMDLNWVECEHCGREILEDSAYGDDHHLCRQCFEAELLPGKLIEFSEESKNFRDEFSEDFWPMVDVPYFVAWVLGVGYIRTALIHEFERYRERCGISLKLCEDFLSDDFGKAEFVDWLIEKEQKEKAGVTSTD